MLSSIKKRKIAREADAIPDVVKKHRKESKAGKVKEAVQDSKVTSKPASEVSILPPPEKSTTPDVQDEAEQEEEEAAPKSFKDLVRYWQSQ